MKVLLIGVGGVGEAMAVIANRRDPVGEWMEQMILADYDLQRAQEVANKIGNPTRFPAEKINARNIEEIIAMAEPQPRLPVLEFLQVLLQ